MSVSNKIFWRYVFIIFLCLSYSPIATYLVFNGYPLFTQECLLLFLIFILVSFAIAGLARVWWPIGLLMVVLVILNYFSHFLSFEQIFAWMSPVFTPIKSFFPSFLTKIIKFGFVITILLFLFIGLKRMGREG